MEVPTLCPYYVWRLFYCVLNSGNLLREAPLWLPLKFGCKKCERLFHDILQITQFKLHECFLFLWYESGHTAY